MQVANLQLSTKETEVMLDAEWILTKHQVIDRVFKAFDSLGDYMRTEVQNRAHLFPENIKYQSPKISKGENYRLLPYLMLDYPSFFWKNNFLAFRTMFWWGNFFSVTLHLSGDNKKKFLKPTTASYLFLKENQFCICVNDEEWQHHFEPSNYLQVSGLLFEEFERQVGKHFCKIAKNIPLTEWQRAPEFLLNTFYELLQMMEINFQADRTGL